jgi:hypothetical protein
MKTTFIYSSRGRPEIFLDTVISNTINEVDIYVGVEASEREIYQPSLDQLAHLNVHLHYFEGPRITKEEMWTPGFIFPPEDQIPKLLTANTKGAKLASLAIEAGVDWIICLVDNLYLPKNFIHYLHPILKAYQNTPTLLAYHNDAARRLVCYPIFTPQWFEWNNFEIQYKGYYHSFGDAEIYLKSLLDNKLVVLPPHLNPTRKHALFGTAPSDDGFWLANDQISQRQAEPIFFRRRDEILKSHQLKFCP